MTTDTSTDAPDTATGTASTGFTPELTAAPPAEPAPASAPAAPAARPLPGPFGITALVLAIVGIAFGQWLLSIAAVVLAVVARSREPWDRTIANWGLVLGLIGAFGWIVLGLLGVVVAAPFALLALGSAPLWF